jgi:hypothetical protein
VRKENQILVFLGRSVENRSFHLFFSHCLFFLRILHYAAENSVIEQRTLHALLEDSLWRVCCEGELGDI